MDKEFRALIAIGMVGVLLQAATPVLTLHKAPLPVPLLLVLAGTLILGYAMYRMARARKLSGAWCLLSLFSWLGLIVLLSIEPATGSAEPQPVNRPTKFMMGVYVPFSLVAVLHVASVLATLGHLLKGSSNPTANLGVLFFLGILTPIILLAAFIPQLLALLFPYRKPGQAFRTGLILGIVVFVLIWSFLLYRWRG